MTKGCESKCTCDGKTRSMACNKMICTDECEVRDGELNCYGKNDFMTKSIKNRYLEHCMTGLL